MLRTSAVLSSAVLVGSALHGQILCINCYDQNARVIDSGVDLVVNGSFEDTDCIPFPGQWDVFCPASGSYSCDIADWTCTGGGVSSYCLIFDNTITSLGDGAVGAYLGSAFGQICPQGEDLSCLGEDGCTVTGVGTGFPTNSEAYGGPGGVSLEQTVPGLTVGAVYRLEFWTGGETFPLPGVFGLDLGFGYTFLRCKPTSPDSIGIRYVVTFQATSTSHTIKFTNWGHVTGSSSEVIVDDVRMFSSDSSGAAVASFEVLQEGCASTITANFTGGTASSYEWTMGDGAEYDTENVTHTYAAAGSYEVTLAITGACGLTASSTRTVVVSDPEPVLAQFIAGQWDPCQGLTVSVQDLTSAPAGSVYTWNMGDGAVISGDLASYTYDTVGIYTIVLEVEDTICGASGTFSQVVELKPDPRRLLTATVPNVFSPNGDGRNDRFFMIPDAGASVRMQVWNRYGGLVYETRGGYVPWDGRVDSKPVPDGVYFYVIEYEVPCSGTTTKGEWKGAVQVVGSGS